jgi:nitrate reductase gamma subunit
MKPKQELNKHDFKTGKPKEPNHIHELQGHLEALLEITERYRREIRTQLRPKSRTERIFDWWGSQSIWDKIELRIMGFLFIIPTILMLTFFLMSLFLETNEHYKTYMDYLTFIRIGGLCSVALIKSIRVLWKLKS